MKINLNAYLDKQEDNLTRSNSQWKDWKWQQRNSLHSVKDIRKFYPNFPQNELEKLAEIEPKYNFRLTPYLVSLIKTDKDSNPDKNDPLYKQFFPSPSIFRDDSVGSYNKEDSNWELKPDFPTPILQHKYDNKALFRISNVCFSHCNYCFEVARVLDKESKKICSNDNLWQKSIDYIKNHPEIEEIIISGGEPLVLSNETLEKRLKSIREISTVKSLRIHTRAFTFNPYRLDKEIINSFKKYNVTELGIHISHPTEITEDFKEILDKFDKCGYGSILKMAQIPLIKGVNDDPEVLHELFMNLYSDCKIKPYYLLHNMPLTPGASEYRTSVKKGVELMNTMKRRIPNVAMPEYIIIHKTGKRTVPLEEPNGTSEFQYSKNKEGYPIINFKNWKGNWETYLDGKD
jgi:lysine 2,3-aminomutase